MSMITNESEMQDLLDEYDRARRDESCPIERRRRERAAERDEEERGQARETADRHTERRAIGATASCACCTMPERSGSSSAAKNSTKALLE